MGTMKYMIIILLESRVCLGTTGLIWKIIFVSDNSFIDEGYLIHLQSFQIFLT